MGKKVTARELVQYYEAMLDRLLLRGNEQTRPHFICLYRLERARRYAAGTWRMVPRRPRPTKWHIEHAGPESWTMRPMKARSYHQVQIDNGETGSSIYYHEGRTVCSLTRLAAGQERSQPGRPFPNL